MNSPPTSRIDAPTSQIPDEWWRGAVIYQIYPRSFLDTNNDGIGDLPGIIKGLDYVASLGVDAIWLSPFFKSPMNDFGYDVSDYCDVDPIFGTLDDFDQLIEKAHKLDLKIIIDQVYSHTSDQHAWFTESRQDTDNPKANWYVWADPKPDGSSPNNWQSVFGNGAWTWDSRRCQYYFHNFLRSQPDLNLHHPDVQNALLDVGRFWLERGVDGFRLDAINFAMHDPDFRDNPPAHRDGQVFTRPFDYQTQQYSQSHPDIVKFLERIRGLVNEYNSIFTVAEIAKPDPLAEMKAFTADNKRLHSAYSFDFLYAHEITPATTKTSLNDWTNDPNEGWPSWAFSNHDAPRAVSRWAEAFYRKDAAECYALLLMCLRGNVFLYQGEELGLPQADIAFEDLQDPEAITNWPLTLGRDGARTPIPWTDDHPYAGFSVVKPWLPMAPDHIQLSIKQQAEHPASTLARIKSFIDMRKNSAALKYGQIDFSQQPGDNILSFYRRSDTETVRCIFNLSAQAQAIQAWPDMNDILANTGFKQSPSEIASNLPPILPAYAGIVATVKR